jgi:hypothetical protein
MACVGLYPCMEGSAAYIANVFMDTERIMRDKRDLN